MARKGEVALGWRVSGAKSLAPQLSESVHQIAVSHWPGQGFMLVIAPATVVLVGIVAGIFYVLR